LLETKGLRQSIEYNWRRDGGWFIVHMIWVKIKDGNESVPSTMMLVVSNLMEKRRREVWFPLKE
jgi:hypothetical protein